MNDTEITTLIGSLGRPHSSGGIVIERAAILAAGVDSPQIIDWIMTHSGTPETPVAPSRGLHGLGARGEAQAAESSRPTRFVLPAGALS
jgi:hypothetical protein